AAAGGDFSLCFPSVKPDSTSVEVACYDQFDDVCEISDDPKALYTRVTLIGTAASDQDGYRRFRSPVVVADWVDPEARGEGHDGWLMLTVAGDAKSPQLMIFRSTYATHWTLYGHQTYEGNPGDANHAGK